MTDKLTLDAWPMSTRTPETKLTVDGSFVGGIAKQQSPSITFFSNTRPVLTIQPSGKIELGEDADPTEAAAQCIQAMDAMIQNMIDNAVKAEVEAITKWLKAHGMRQVAMMIEKGDYK